MKTFSSASNRWRLSAGIIALALCAPAYAAPQEPEFTLAQKEKSAVIETLRALVEIETGSRDREGLDKMAELLRSRLAALGARVEVVTPADTVKLHDTPPFVAKVVVARFEGTGVRNIMLLAHMDTVYPRGTLAKRPFRIEGARAYGPGIADDKGGMAVILHTLAILRTLNFRDYKTLTVVINGDEEISTPGARNLITKLGSEHDVVLSCEPTPANAPNQPLGLATSGIAAATVTVRGKSAHAGVAPELGRNALIELSNQLVQMRDLSVPTRQIKFNWTMSNAGTTRNVIPDVATAVADVRVQRVADYDAIEKSFRDQAGKHPIVPDTRVEADFERRRPPLEVTDAARVLGRQAQAIYGELGRKLDVDESGRGGGTDAAFAALSGKPAVLESFGLAGFNYHSSGEEYVELDSIEPRLYLLTRLIMEAARGR